MKKVCNTIYSIELTDNELDILNKAKKIIDELEDFAWQNNIKDFELCSSIDDYIRTCKRFSPNYNKPEVNEAAWTCPDYYTEEQKRCFYGDFG